ncbi:M14 family zinc carboxypeptidase [Microbacterium sp. SSW1-59]|uniref:M14 family zinc carboxypeptidase n=1 Tax=Microbacterium xanthum TaxID=3079794 RepID=UPI002AD508CC|nr:M14 family zinc carboxypeptidase [Microbacterium sp. SSW1-59]MDZ8201191.1 M14 family zinc carboxypeptidase [Microbacterium sp. SSW1-59]
MHRRPVLLGLVGSALLVAPLAATPAVAAVEEPALPIVRPAVIGDMPTAYPYQPELRVFPDDPTDASIARGVMPYDEIAPTLNGFMDLGDRVSTQVIGTSELGKDIYLVTVTSPETAAETAQQTEWRRTVKYDPAAAAADEDLLAEYKIPLWFNANIHGNEWEGTDATLNYIEDLATSTDPEIVDLIDTHRLYFTVTNNPDGRALGQRATANGYDANRDAITGATAEAAIIRDLSAVLQPTYFIDLHGYTNILQVEPCGPPHGENYEYDLFLPHAYATALEIEERVVDAAIEGNPLTSAGGIRIPYRDIRAGWDDWPPIFMPQYVAYQGAITNTVELPLGRSGDQPARAAINIEVAEVVIDTVSDYVQEHGEALLSNQIEIFERGLTGAPSVEIPSDVAPEDLPVGMPTEWTAIWDETDIYVADYPRAYVIPQGDGQRSDSDAVTLVRQLLVHGVEVDRLTAPLTVGDTVYPTGSYYVDMHQPVRGLANVLLSDGTDISERVPDMYDVSAWSLSLLWGADVDAVGKTGDAAPTTAVEHVTSVALSGSVDTSAAYLAFDTAGVADYQVINELLAEGVTLSQLPDGTVLMRRSAEVDAAAAAAADLYGVHFRADDGVALRTGDAVGLEPVTVAYVNNTDDRDALTKLGFTDMVAVTSATLTSGAVTLDDVDLLWVGSGLNFNGSQAAGRAVVQAYLDAGKPVVGRGTSAASFAASFGLASLSTVSGTGGSNGIVSIETAAGGVLADHPVDTAFAYPAVWFTGLGDDITVERSYAADPFVSGHWPASTGRSQADAAGQASEVSTVTSTGNRVFLFGTTPTFRNHPVGAFSDIARAVFWATASDSALTPPVTAEDLTPEARGVVDAPDEITAGEDATIGVGSDRDGALVSAYLFPAATAPGSMTLRLAAVAGDVAALGGAVVDGTAFTVTVPADVVPDAYRLAVLDDAGVLIGWDEVQVLAAPTPTPTPTPTEPTPEPTDDAEPTPEPTEDAEPTATPQPAGGSLPTTGGGDTGALWAGALALMLVGAGVTVIARARARAHL